jgi:hypothetical protein
MKNIIVIFILFVSLVSCKDKTENNEAFNNQEIIDSNSIEKVSKKKQIGQGKDTLKTIINSDFANLPFGYMVNLDNVKHFFDSNEDSLIIKKQVIQNYHNDKIDTLYSFSSNAKEFLLYKSSTGVFLNRANIRDSLIKLNNGISIGITKEKFLEKFNSKIIDLDVFMITDEEQYSSHIFYFKEDKLINLEIYHNID